MPRFADTIAAQATPSGESALAVLRVSGPDTKDLATALLGRMPSPRAVRRLDYRDRHSRVIDDVLAVFFKGPRSYTGEDSLEISCHGSPFVARRILDDLFARGCRPAAPGEFTQRAFLNGRMDLSQAEAVMDLIHARSDHALTAANLQLRGALGRRMNDVVDRLVETLARIEAYIDFPDEDLPAEDNRWVAQQIESVQAEAAQLLATRRYGDMLRDGIRTVIAGAPNVGKSSLLNCLVGRDRALVSPEPGTTRDYVEERVVLGNHCLRLIDTAGINASPAPLERRGIEKSFECLDDADLVLAVIDASSDSLHFPAELITHLESRNCVIVLNKADAAPHLPDRILGYDDRPHVAFSAKTGAGLENLIEAITALVDKMRPNHDGELIAINARHAKALEDARAALGAASEKLQTAAGTELLASDLRLALEAFEQIAGKIDSERVLDRLFASFCIGK
jgi:tRNA modification GTPase